jgi:hypothetical protein
VRDRTGRTIQVQQARAAALGRRLLRDELGWKIEVEVADVHARDRC